MTLTKMASARGVFRGGTILLVTLFYFLDENFFIMPSSFHHVGAVQWETETVSGCPDA